ncbi:MAG: metallophosphoesterase [Nanoarchaeota archaeon]|nr:metallophosphoesterase [Nanoarchaeota archaeon]
MKFLIVGDLHGHKPLIHYKDFDAIIAPGDFCSDAPRKYMFQSLQEHLKNPNSKINWYDLTGKKKAIKIIKKSISDGASVLKKLNSFNVPVYVVPGNWDWTGDSNSQLNILRKNYYNTINKLSNIIDVHNKLFNVCNYQIIGHGISSGPEYPQDKKELKSMKKNELKKLKKAYEKELKNMDYLFKRSSKPLILLSHNIPFNTSLDKITNKQSPRYGYHYGSLIARKVIDKYHPLICIGGHMHEHFGKEKIGKTTVINTGFGPKVNTLLELEGNKIKKLKFYGKSLS